MYMHCLENNFLKGKQLSPISRKTFTDYFFFRFWFKFSNDCTKNKFNNIVKFTIQKKKPNHLL